MKKVIILYYLFSTMLLSCSTDFDTNQIESDMPYISLNDNVDFSHLSDNELKIIFSAESRMGIKNNEEGMFIMRAKSAQEINVSENIYNFFVEIVESSNENLLSKYTITRRPILSRGGEEDFIEIYDCVAYCMVGTGRASTLEEAIAKIEPYTNGYGVPTTNMIPALNQFGNAVEVNKLDVGRSPETFANTCIVVIDGGINSEGKNMLHAVVGLYYTKSGYLYYNDYLKGKFGLQTNVGSTHHIYMFND